MHWVLDVVFNEDGTRIRDDNSSQNLVVLHRMALNLLREDKSNKLSLRAKRLKTAWNDAYLRKILVGRE